MNLQKPALQGEFWSTKYQAMLYNSFTLVPSALQDTVTPLGLEDWTTKKSIGLEYQ